MAKATKDNNKVTIETLRWDPTLYPKQRSEGQPDSFGEYQKEVRLVKLDEAGLEVQEVVVQTDGKPTERSVPTIQRQAVKLLVAMYFTSGSNKGLAYAHTLALNLERVEPSLRKMAEGNWFVDASYGSSPKSASPLFASVTDLLTLSVGLVKVRASTKDKYPDPVVTEAREVEVREEEVSISF